VRIAYIVLAHKLPEQLVRLVERLSSPTSVFVIHVDSKSPERVFRTASRALASDDRVHFLERRPIAWSGFSQVAATLRAVERLRRLGTEFDYAFLLTGQHYPIKPASEIEGLLEEAQGRSLIEHFALPWCHWRAEAGGLNRLQYPYLEIKGRVIRLPIRRRIPSWLVPHGGSAYWCLSRECLEYVLDVVAMRPQLVRFFKTARCSDELFFQTVLCNSPLRDQLVDESLTFTHWTPGSPHPAILRGDHIGDLASSPALFARKFDITVDDDVLDLIDERLLGEVRYAA
jgi:hypothetical protein